MPACVPFLGPEANSAPTRRHLALAALLLAALTLLWPSAPLVAQPLVAQPPSPAAISPLAQEPGVAAAVRSARAWLTTQLDHAGVPGGAIAVVYDQSPVMLEGFGTTAEGGNVPVTGDTQFSICSVSKLFTSVAAMQQVEAGKLDLDAPIQRYLPWFSIKASPTEAAPVTVRGLLSHVSGLPREVDYPYWTDVDFPDRDAVQARVPQQEMLYRPFTRFQYSNLGMTLLGEIVANQARRDFPIVISTAIFRPLGLTMTTPDLDTSGYGTRMAQGYGLRGSDGRRLLLQPYQVKGIGPAAGFASTARDLSRFAAWQFRLLGAGMPEILSADTLRTMQRVHWLDTDWDGAAWGLGFAIRRHQGRSFVGHGGYCPGFRTAFYLRPEEKIAVIAMINVNDVDVNDLAFAVYDLIAPTLRNAAAEMSPAPDPDMQANGQGQSAADDPATRHANPFLHGRGQLARFERFEGVYERPGMPTRYFIAATPYGLLVTDLFEDHPAARQYMLHHEGGSRFRRVARDGALAEPVWFDLDESGHGTRMWTHSNYLERRQ